MKKFIIITSIFGPTIAVKKFATISDWQLIVVGDKKSPEDWNCNNVVYLSPIDQEKLGYPVIKKLPWNSYTRKIVGYLYAIKNGASIIADTDDDNIPYANWGKDIPFEGFFDTIDSKKFINIYKFFSQENIWPRGYPLDKILNKKMPKTSVKRHKVGIWQFLANGDPDVDAIYRLTINKHVFFKNRKKIILEKNTVSPFNSQNTFFNKDLFPLLYLPSFVTFRFTDILRGLVAQPILWNYGYKLGFGKATVLQKRNPHDYLRDFESEIPVYLESENILNIAKKAIVSKSTLKENLLNVYLALKTNGIVNNEEVATLKLWLKNF